MLFPQTSPKEVSLNTFNPLGNTNRNGEQGKVVCGQARQCTLKHVLMNVYIHWCRLVIPSPRVSPQAQILVRLYHPICLFCFCVYSGTAMLFSFSLTISVVWRAWCNSHPWVFHSVLGRCDFGNHILKKGQLWLWLA